MYIKFNDSDSERESPVQCTVIPQGGTIVTLRFPTNTELVVNTSGFTLYLDAEMLQDIGGDSYTGFTTIYRNDNETARYNGYQLSNDGSVYTAPQLPDPEEFAPEPYVPTLEEVQEQKITEMNLMQQSVIQSGVQVTLFDGTQEHFTLSEHDQTSLMGLQTQVAQGVDNIPWHTSDQTQHCRYYSNADMALIVTAAMQYVTYHVTYYRDLRIYIRSLDNKDEVNTVYYGMEIPPEYQSEPLRDMLSAMAAGGTDAED